MSHKHACPYCEASTAAMTMEEIIASRKLSDIEAAVLEAVWGGKGMPVPTQKIFDLMYADDPNGGPSPSNAYNVLKRAMAVLDDALRGTGIKIAKQGLGKGYALRMEV